MLSFKDAQKFRHQAWMPFPGHFNKNKFLATSAVKNYSAKATQAGQRIYSTLDVNYNNTVSL